MKNLNSFTLEYIYDEIDVFSLFKFDQIKIRSSLKIKLYTYIYMYTQVGLELK